MRGKFCLLKPLAVCAAFALHASSAQAEVIADSIAEFSGVPGQNGWHNGYRIYFEGETDNYDPAISVILFAGGEGQGAWDGFAQTWTGSAWDLNTAASQPWTMQAAETVHPNGINNGEEHWPFRRWVADELTATTPIAIMWHTRKQSAAGGGVTGGIFVNGELLDWVAIPGSDTTGVTRTNYLNAEDGDIIDLVLTPVGPSGDRADGSDGSLNWMRIDTTLPEVPRQPDGSIFIPLGAADTDGDGLADFWERVFYPDLTRLSATGDADADGLNDRAELDSGTDPSSVDSDGDGLRDGVETDTGTFVSATDTGTNPRVVDTDGDGRTDGAEVNGPPVSNPLLTDTDGDLFSDGSEVSTGHNPSDANNNPDTTAIANSMTEFSGVQGQANWFHGYRSITGDAPILDYPTNEFTPFPEEAWTGAQWDLNTEAAAPWTELGAENTHPNGSNNGAVHWTIRRWRASGITDVTAMGLRYHVRKSNVNGGNGVTAAIYVNGELGDSVTIAGNDGTGVTRTYWANIAPGDLIDLILSPRGADNTDADGNDGSFSRLEIDPTLPGDPRQPDGSIFIPANAGDSDGDSIPDVWEEQYGPDLNRFSRTGDFDGDLLSDLDEFGRESDPTKPDTDDDGLSDLVETGTGTYVSPTNTGSDPQRADTDLDGLTDQAEVTGTPRTDPNKGDSDSDGFNDPAEIQAGTDPNNGEDNPLTFVIANSQAEFSGVQGSNGWFNGYRNYTLDGGATNYDASVDFIPYEGGAGMGDWDGFAQMWTGSAWDLNTAAAGPWTFQNASGIHPNGINSPPTEEHWAIRRWVASELTNDTPVAILWLVQKQAAAGGGVTGSLHVNGDQVDFETIPGTATSNEVRRYYLNLKKDDVIDLAVTPQGPADRNDPSDGSISWFWVDTRLPREPRQPNGDLFIPANATADSDADGLVDFWELIYAANLTTFTGTGDNDADGLPNTGELTRDTNPLVADTDEDGLSDAAETKTGTFVSATDTGSNPRLGDSDGDGLSDSAEVQTHQTNPNKTDTDDDTYSDAAELASGHNPRDGGHNPTTSGIADSRTEFSGVQGQNGWRYGYRNATTDGGATNYTDAMFILFPGGDGMGEWDGVTQVWTGTQWDLDTGGAPWTELGVENSHPNGDNNQEIHWTVRRWEATEMTEARPLAIRYNVRKTNPSGSGVTGAIYINGNLADSVTIAGNNSAGVTRTYYAVVNPGDKIDLVHTPRGTDGTNADGADGSALWMQIDTVLPPNPTQPDGTLFVPGGLVQIQNVTIAVAGVTITWGSSAGATYRVEASENLQNWTLLQAAHPSGGAQTSYTDTASPRPAYRFYRIARE